MLRTDVYVTADLYQAKRHRLPLQNKHAVACNPEGGGGVGNSHMKGAGMLVVSLRGVNLTSGVLSNTPLY